VYPAQELLQEVGRVTIAGPRLEVQMGALWWQLDKDSVDEITARKDSASRQAASADTGKADIAHRAKADGDAPSRSS
jgi:hypothetical protein